MTIRYLMHPDSGRMMCAYIDCTLTDEQRRVFTVADLGWPQAAILTEIPLAAERAADPNEWGFTVVKRHEVKRLQRTGRLVELIHDGLLVRKYQLVDSANEYRMYVSLFSDEVQLSFDGWDNWPEETGGAIK